MVWGEKAWGAALVGAATLCGCFAESLSATSNSTTGPPIGETSGSSTSGTEGGAGVSTTSAGSTSTGQTSTGRESEALETTDGASDSTTDQTADAESTAAPACVATCPSGHCIGETCALRVFVSSETYQGGAFGGLEAADTLCNELGDAAGLGGDFLAWLSSGTGSPSQRFTDGGPYVRMDNELVSTSFLNLIATGPEVAINLDEYGEPGPASDTVCGVTSSVWTGTAPDGTHVANQDCVGWSDPLGDALLGNYALADDRWTNDCSSTLTCSGFYPIYCFEQP